MNRRSPFPGCLRPPNAWSHDPSRIEVAVAEAVEALQRNRDERERAVITIARAADWYARAEQPLPEFVISAIVVALRLQRVKVASAEQDEDSWPDRWGRADRIRLVAMLRRLSEEGLPLRYGDWWAVISALGLGDRNGLRKQTIAAAHGGLRSPDEFARAARLEGIAAAEGRKLTVSELAKEAEVDRATIRNWREREDWQRAVEANRFIKKVHINRENCSRRKREEERAERERMRK